MEEKAVASFRLRRRQPHLHRPPRVDRFQRVLGPMGEVAQKLARQELPSIDPEARVYFRDVQDHIRRVQLRVDGLREVLISVFELSTLLEQQQWQGTITRQLAAWAAILAVPTAIGSAFTE